MNHLDTSSYHDLPPTDSRFRPDIRALEFRELPTAEKEKKRMEDKQKQREENLRAGGRNVESRWFTKTMTQEGEELYVSNDKYWGERRRGVWEDSEDIF